jgi:hypothetical protein
MPSQVNSLHRFKAKPNPKNGWIKENARLSYYWMKKTLRNHSSPYKIGIHKQENSGKALFTNVGTFKVSLKASVFKKNPWLAFAIAFLLDLCYRHNKTNNF